MFCGEPGGVSCKVIAEKCFIPQASACSTIFLVPNQINFYLSLLNYFVRW